MTTAHTLVAGALRAVSSLSPGEGVPGEEAENALAVLNRMLKAWSASNLMAPCRTLESFPLAAGVSSRTVGPAGQLATGRPDYVTDAFLRDAGGSDSPLRPMSKKAYNAIPSKTAGGTPARYYYDPQFPLGVLYFDCATGQAYTLFLESTKPVNQFATLQTDMALPGEYEEAIVYLLAQRLAPEYGFPIAANPDIALLVRQAEEFIRRKNVAPVEAGFDAGIGPRGRFDINTGGAWS